MGRSHGPFGLHELVNIKYVGMDFLKKKSQTWWFPYDQGLPEIMEKAITLFHGSGRMPKLKAAWGLRTEFRRLNDTSPLLNYILALPRMLRK
jgi:hypothetical protein